MSTRLRAVAPCGPAGPLPALQRPPCSCPTTTSAPGPSALFAQVVDISDSSNIKLRCAGLALVARAGGGRPPGVPDARLRGACAGRRIHEDPYTEKEKLSHYM